MAPKRILLIARDMVGDLVNTTGAAEWIRAQFPSASVVVECGPSGRDLFPDLEVWVRKRGGGLRGKVRRVNAYRQGRFDLAVILDDSREAARLARLAGIRTFAPQLLPKSVDGETPHDLFDPLDEVLTQLSEEMAVLAPCWDDLKPKLPLSPLMGGEGWGVGVVIFHVTASDRAKEWPEERWIELAKRIEGVIAGGPSDETIVRRIAEASGRPALPPLSLLDYAAAIRQAQVVVTADTGPAHIAAAVHTHAVVLYGPTDPSRFHPWGTNWTALRRPMGCDHYGVGCAHRTDGSCSQACMRTITVDEVLAAIRSSWSLQPLPEQDSDESAS